MNDSRKTSATGATRGQVRRPGRRTARRCTPGRSRCRGPRRRGSPVRPPRATTRRRCRRPSRRRTPRPAARGRSAATPTRPDRDGERRCGPAVIALGTVSERDRRGPAAGVDAGESSCRQRRAERRRHRRGTVSAVPDPVPADRYPGTDFDRHPRHDGRASPTLAAVTVWQRLRRAADLLRRGGVRRRGGAVAVACSRSSRRRGDAHASTWVWPSIPATALAQPAEPALAGDRARRSGRASSAAWSADESSFLWPAVAALVFASIAEDQRDPPRGSAGSRALLGAVCSLIAGAETPEVAAVRRGGASAAAPALLLRSRLRTAELTVEADELRGQAAWLEQRTSPGPRAARRGRPPGHRDGGQAEAGQVGDPRPALRTIAELGRTALGELDALVVHLRDPERAAVRVRTAAPARHRRAAGRAPAPAGGRRSVRLDAGPRARRGRRAHRLPDRAGGADQRRPPRAGHGTPGSSWTAVGDRASGCGSATTGSGRRHAPRRGSGLLGHRGAGDARAAGAGRSSERPGGGTILDVDLPVGSPMTPGRGGRRPAAGPRRVRADPRRASRTWRWPCRPRTATSSWTRVRADPRIDVALVDIRMPVLDGLAATRALAAVPHAPAVIVVTTFDDDAYVLDAIAAGARGFLLKRCSGRELVDAVRTVAAGGSILSAEVTGAVLDRVRAPGPATAADLGGVRPHRPASATCWRWSARAQQHRDRRPAPPVDEHGEVPRHQRARQDRQPRPGAGRHPRVRAGLTP